MVFNEEMIRDSLRERLIGGDIFFLETVDSTNTYTQELIRKGAGGGSVIIADHQSKGKGRFGRSWFSPAGTGLWMSVILKGIGNETSANTVNYVCILSVVEAINDLISIKSEIKWPNDILLNKKKICGVLSEMVSSENEKNLVIAGIGLNINQTLDDFPAELREIATSLRIISGSEYVREEVIIKILKSLEKNYRLAIDEGTDFIFKKWLKQCTTVGKKVRVVTSERHFDGIAEAVKPDGRLVLRDEKNEIKEVTPIDIIQIIEYIS